MFRLILFTIFCISLVWSHLAKPDDVEPAHVAYTRHFLRNYPDRLKSIMELIPVIEGHAALNALDPIVPVVVMSLESSMKFSVTGKRGERGYFQIIPDSVCSRGYDIDDPRQNIEAGIRCIAAARDACDGSLLQTLSAYQSGSCEPRTPTTRRKIMNRVRIVEKWRNR